MTDSNDEKDDIDRAVEEAAEKRKARAPKNVKGGSNEGRKYADYQPCPLCGTEVLSLPAHLPCDND